MRGRSSYTVAFKEFGGIDPGVGLRVWNGHVAVSAGNGASNSDGGHGREKEKDGLELHDAVGEVAGLAEDCECWILIVKC